MKYLNRIICGDTLEVTKGIPDNSIDLIFADPPFNRGKDYGIDKDKRADYHTWIQIWIKDCFRILKETGNFFIMIDSKNVGYFQVAMDKYGIFENLIIWTRGGATTKKKFNPYHQDILFYSKNHDLHYFKFDAEHKPIDKRKDWLCKEKFRRHDLGDRINEIWDDIKYLTAGMYVHKETILKNGTREKLHPCQMPLKLIKRILKFASEKNSLIFDPFLGSGTTTVACKQLNRKYIGIEINPDYCRIARERLMAIPDSLFKDV